MIDCLIVGGGPAGLTAAIYLARFHLEVLVVDGGNSRAMLIPKTRNHAGFPEGITGPNLLRRMSQQARIYGARVVEGNVDALLPEGEGFRAIGSMSEMVAPGAAHALDPGQRDALVEAGVRLVDGPTGGFELSGDRIRMDSAAGVLAFASIYPALGSAIRSELGVALGAETSSDGCLLVDAHQRTSVAGLYAAGDVVKGLDQISHAMGEGGVAATTIRNDLAETKPLWR